MLEVEVVGVRMRVLRFVLRSWRCQQQDSGQVIGELTYEEERDETFLIKNQIVLFIERRMYLKAGLEVDTGDKVVQLDIDPANLKLTQRHDHPLKELHLSDSTSLEWCNSVELSVLTIALRSSDN